MAILLDKVLQLHQYLDSLGLPLKKMDFRMIRISHSGKFGGDDEDGENFIECEEVNDLIHKNRTRKKERKRGFIYPYLLLYICRHVRCIPDVNDWRNNVEQILGLASQMTKYLYFKSIILTWKMD